MHGASLTQLLVIFVVAILIAYVVGITIVSTVDKKMNNISINIPDLVLKIKDKAEAFVTAETRTDGIEHFKNKPKASAEAAEVFADNFETADDIALKKNVEPFCIRYHKHNPRISYGRDRCTYGRTNYEHPDAMARLDRNVFKQFFQQNFTLQDYVNWLHLYVDSRDELDYVHLRNLDKIMKGEKITTVPAATSMPANIKCFSENSKCYSKIFNE